MVRSLRHLTDAVHNALEGYGVQRSRRELLSIFASVGVVTTIEYLDSTGIRPVFKGNHWTLEIDTVDSDTHGWHITKLQSVVDYLQEMNK